MVKYKLTVAQLKKIHSAKRADIVARLKEFREIWLKKSNDIFIELAFCLLTPQSRAKICWQAVSNLVRKNLLFDGSALQIARELKGVRFKNNKAKYILQAKKLFSSNGRIAIKAKLRRFSNISETREWLIGNVRGMGYKEASHFLRNVGLANDIAILDRHILKNLKLLKVIGDIPRSLSKKRYLETEKEMRVFAEKINIPMDQLDLVLWCKETGEIFK